MFLDMFLNINTISVWHGKLKFQDIFSGVQNIRLISRCFFSTQGVQMLPILRYLFRLQGLFKTNGVKQALIIFFKNIGQI